MGKREARPAKGWPKDICKPVDYEKLIDPVVAAIKATHNLTRKNEGKPIPWKGFEETTTTGRACSYTFLKEILSKDSLKYNAERDRDLLTVLVMVGVSLGIEQGRRLERELCLRNRMFLRSDDSKLGFSAKEMRAWLEEWSGGS